MGKKIYDNFFTLTEAHEIRFSYTEQIYDKVFIFSIVFLTFFMSYKKKTHLNIKIKLVFSEL